MLLIDWLKSYSHVFVVSGWLHRFICRSWYTVHPASDVRLPGSTTG